MFATLTHDEKITIYPCRIANTPFGAWVSLCEQGLFFSDMKETFIIRTEWAEAIMELEPMDQATIFQNLFNFHLGNENLINLNNLSVKLVWKLIEPNLKRNIAAYDKRSVTSADNGRLGGRPKNEVAESQEEKPNSDNLNNLTEKPIETKKPIESLSVSDSVSNGVSDGVSDGDSKKKTSSGKPDSLTFEFLELYNKFLEEKIGTTEQFSVAGRAGLSKTIRYLREQVQKKHEGADVETIANETINAWRWILSNFDRWDKFHQNQLKLEQINSNLINIITTIKNGNSKTSKRPSARDLAAEAFAISQQRNQSTEDSNASQG